MNRTTQEILTEALQLQLQGSLTEAERLYQQVLTAQPNHPDCLHLLGTIAYRRGELELAVERIGQALAVRPDFPEALSNLGNVHKRRGKFDEAVDCFSKALALRPDNADAYNNLAHTLYVQGKHDEAVVACQKAIAIRPQLPEAHANLGNALRALGKLDDAITALETALQHRPGYPEALRSLGNAYATVGRNDDAAAAYRQALVLRPHFAEVHCDLGAALTTLGRLDEAVAEYRAAIDQRPAFIVALNNLAAVLLELGRYDDAIANARKVLAISPDYAHGWLNLGIALAEQGRRDEASRCFLKALELKPDYPEALNNLARALQEDGRLDEAIGYCRRALALKPDLAAAHINLGLALTDLGRLDEAIASYRRAIALSPNTQHPYSNLLMSLHYAERQFEEEYTRTVRSYTELMKATASRRGFANEPAADRRLRIGYVSADLRDHPVGFFLSCALPARDRSAVEVFCYSTSMVDDATTAVLRASVDHWRMVAGKSNGEVDALIQQDAIDILVDLSGHTARNRLALFATRAAPVQVTWLGYFGTTGLPTMDYILADRFVVPPGEEGLFSESVLRLPDSYICFAPPSYDVPILPRPTGEPARFRSETALVLGCFNNWSKVSDGTVYLWARILRELPDSRLFLKTRFLDNPDVRRLALQRFAEHGVAAERLILEGPCRRADLLAAYNRMDIALDPFPYGGGVTTAEALWMGVPVVCRRGNRWVSRVAESIVSTAGLPDLVAGDADDYVAIVHQLAEDRARRDDLRRALRPMMLASPLCDGPRFARSLEVTYRSMWKTWCEQHPSRRRSDP